MTLSFRQKLSCWWIRQKSSKGQITVNVLRAIVVPLWVIIIASTIVGYWQIRSQSQEIVKTFCPSENTR